MINSVQGQTMNPEANTYPYKYPDDPIQPPMVIRNHRHELDAIDPNNHQQTMAIQQIRSRWEPDYGRWYIKYLSEPNFVKKAWYYELFMRSQNLMWIEIYKAIRPERQISYPFFHWDPDDYEKARDFAETLPTQHPLARDFKAFEDELASKLRAAESNSGSDSN